MLTDLFQTHHLQKRRYIPTWVGVALAAVVFNNRAYALINGDKITKLREQVEELITEGNSDGFGNQGAESVTASDESIKTNKGNLIGPGKGEKKMLAGWQGGEDSEELHKWWMDRSDDA